MSWTKKFLRETDMKILMEKEPKLFEKENGEEFLAVDLTLVLLRYCASHLFNSLKNDPEMDISTFGSLLVFNESAEGFVHPKK